MICDIVADKDERTTQIGQLGTFLGLGFLVGAVGGGFLSGVAGYTLNLYLTLAVALVEVVVATWMLPETTPAVNVDADKPEVPKQSLLATVKGLMTQTETRGVGWLHVALLFALVFPQTAYMDHLRLKLELSVNVRSVCLLVLGLVAAAAPVSPL